VRQTLFGRRVARALVAISIFVTAPFCNATPVTEPSFLNASPFSTTVWMSLVSNLDRPFDPARAPAETPEPGTSACAGVALIALGMVKRRRNPKV
jgi:hypothetical protein